MSRVFSTEAPFPAAAVTFASAETRNQQILFATRYDVTGAYKIAKENEQGIIEETVTECEKQFRWAIKSISVSNLRDWSQSTALITLTTKVDSINQELPPLPRVDRFRGNFQTEEDSDSNQYPFLAPEDEIRIYAGYLDSPTTPITGDLLDEVPFDIGLPEDKENGILKPNFTKPLVPIFWGFIDKIDFDANPKSTGYNILISCRDRARIFGDMKLLSIPSLAGIGKNNATVPMGALWNIIKDVALATTGVQNRVSREKQKRCWKEILVGPEYSPLVEFYSAYDDTNSNRLSRLGEDTLDPSRWMRRAAFKIMDHKARPRFHTWLNRPPLAKEGETQSWQVLDRSPMEIIKWIAEKEERPTDFFCSHVNGDFVLGPRAIDITGFKDPDRMYRTYFFQSYPKVDKNGNPCAPPCVNQLILKFRSFISTVGTFNRFIVVDTSRTNGSGSSLFDDVRLTLDRRGELTKNRKTPCKQRILYDGALSTYGNASGAALLSALSASNQFSRDIGGVQFTVLGDPTFFPGEAVRIYNSILHDVNSRSVTGRQEELEVKETERDKVSARYSNTPAALGTGIEDTTVSKGENNAVAKLIEEAGTQLTNKNQFQLPVYKIRAITHNIITSGSNAGFTTVVQAALDLT